MKPKPCPFCKKEPSVFPLDPKIEGTVWGKVECINKDCPAKNVGVYDGIEIADDRGAEAYKEAAIQ